MVAAESLADNLEFKKGNHLLDSFLNDHNEHELITVSMKKGLLFNI